MPTLARRLCSCGQVHDAPCPKRVHRQMQHQEATDRQRGTATERGYGAGWRRIRAQVLREEPLCMCEEHKGAGNAPVSDTVDHITPKAKGGTDARSNLQGMHHDCHSKKTAREDGGFGNPTKPDLTHLAPSAIPVTIVTGAPGSGKSAYVQQHAGPSDIVIDLDQIRAEVSGQPIYRSDEAWLGPAIEERDRRLMHLATASAPRCWFIVSAPEARTRWWWAKRIGTRDVVVIETPKSECMSRVHRDTRRPASTIPETQDAITRWWSSHSRSEHDRIVTPKSGP